MEKNKCSAKVFKLWYIYTRYYMAMKINELHYCYIHQLGACDKYNVKEKKPAQKNYCITPFMKS